MMFAVASAAILVALALAIARAIKGPTVFDRVLAGNTVGTLAIMLLAVIGFLDRTSRIPRHRAHLWPAQSDRNARRAEVFPPWRLGLRCRHGAPAVTVLIDALSWACILLGSFFTVVGAFGLVRMPEVFTRMHAASVTDTLGVGFLILGMGLQAGLSLVTLKLLFLLALFFFTAPVVTHALARACMHEGIQPMLNEDRRARAGPQPEHDGRQP